MRIRKSANLFSNQNTISTIEMYRAVKLNKHSMTMSCINMPRFRIGQPLLVKTAKSAEIQTFR